MAAIVDRRRTGTFDARRTGARHVHGEDRLSGATGFVAASRVVHALGMLQRESVLGRRAVYVGRDERGTEAIEQRMGCHL